MVFEWNPLKENTSIIGASQVGKTWFCKNLVRMLSSMGYNVVIYAVHTNFFDIDITAVKRYLRDIHGRGLEIYFPSESSDQNFTQFNNLIYSMQNVVVVWDELHNFCTKQSAEPSLKRFARNCSNRNLGYIAIFQAPSEVPGFILRNSKHIFCMYLDLPTDIEYMKKWIGPEVEYFKGNWPIESREGFYKKQGVKAEKFSAL